MSQQVPNIFKGINNQFSQYFENSRASDIPINVIVSSANIREKLQFKGLKMDRAVSREFPQSPILHNQEAMSEDYNSLELEEQLNKSIVKIEEIQEQQTTLDNHQQKFQKILEWFHSKQVLMGYPEEIQQKQSQNKKKDILLIKSNNYQCNSLTTSTLLERRKLSKSCNDFSQE